MEPECSLLHSQKSATYTYLEPDNSSPCPIQLTQDLFLYYPIIHLYLYLASGFFLSGLLTKTLYKPAACPTHLIFLIWSSELHLVSSDDHEAPRYLVFSTPLLPCTSEVQISQHCSHPTTQRPTTATNHIQQNQHSTPYAVTHGLCSPEDGHNDARNMLRQKLIINIWLLHLVGVLPPHKLY